MHKLFFFNELKRLKEVGIPVILTFGNHDYVRENRFWYEFEDNVIVFEGEKVETVILETDNNKKIAISGFSYQSPAINYSKLSEFPEREKSVNHHIGIYHGENEAEGNYAPFLLAEMKHFGYEYWALGHIHLPLELNESQPKIVYPGTPQGHTKKETFLKGIALVTLNGSFAEVDYKKVAEFDFETVAVSLPDTTFIEMCTKIKEKISPKTVTTLVLTAESFSEEFREAVLSGELEKTILADYWIEEIVLEEKTTNKIPLSLTNQQMKEILTTDLVQNEKANMAQNLSPNVRNLLRKIDNSDLATSLEKSLKTEVKWGE